MKIETSLDRRNGTASDDGPDDESASAYPAFGVPLLLTEAQAAALLSMSKRKVWELAACGAIPCVKIGTLKRYRRIDLEEWVKRGCPISPSD